MFLIQQKKQNLEKIYKPSKSFSIPFKQKSNMEFTPLEYRNVEHQFLQQFGLKTLDFYEKSINFNNLIEYKKILNQLKTKRHNYLLIKEKNSHIHSRGKTSDLILNQTEPINEPVEQQQPCFYITQNTNFNSSAKNNKIKEMEQKQGINPNSCQNRKNGLEHTRSLLVKSKVQCQESQNNENLNIDCLNDKIYGQYSILECLKHEESQVQEAIFCFKKRIIALQNQFSLEQIKSKQVDRLLAENNNDMLRAKHTNQQIKQSYIKTRKHFELDLQGRKQIQQKFNDKNREEFEQSVINHIYMKKMKSKIAEQQKELKYLHEKTNILQKKQRKYNFIYKKQQQLYKAYQQIQKLTPQNLFNKPIVSILDKDFQHLEQQHTHDNSNSNDRTKGMNKPKITLIKKHSDINQNQISINNSSNTSTVSNIQQGRNQQIDIKIYTSPNSKKNKQPGNSKSSKKIKKKQQIEKRQLIASQKQLYQIVEEIVKLYETIKKDENNKISQFKILINQRDQKQAELNKYLKKIVDNYVIMFENIKMENPEDKKRLEQLSTAISNISKQLQFYNNSSNGIEERMKFYLSKQINIIQKIINLWLKSDKVSNKFMQSLTKKFNEIFLFNTLGNDHKPNSTEINNKNKNHSLTCNQQLQQKELCLHDSKSLLISYFENWKDYLPFLDIIHENVLIYKYINKNKLSKLFKRIIKTKIVNQSIPTEEIFHKAIDATFQEGRLIHLERIKRLLDTFRELYSYLNKAISGQVLLNCAINYQILDCEIQQTEPNTQASKLASRNELQRVSYSRQSKERNSNSSQQQNQRFSIQMSVQERKRLSMGNESSGGILKNIKNQEIISKLKKKRPIKRLNMHEFYENMRGEIQKINKIQTF